jgi:hypothetical protein
MYRSGSVERLNVEVLATDGNCKILLLNFETGVLFLVYQASEH